MFKKIRIRGFRRIVYSYFKRCPYCGYAGNDWGDSGECPCCGEVS